MDFHPNAEYTARYGNVDLQNVHTLMKSICRLHLRTRDTDLCVTRPAHGYMITRL